MRRWRHDHKVENITLYQLIAVGTVGLVQILYWALFMFRVRRPAAQVSNYTRHPLSVIICARNEADNLERLIPALMRQKYDNFEVIVVDDQSEDGTGLLLAQFKEKYPHLYYTQIAIDRKFSHGKRLALTVGIKAAHHEHMVFTDADCVPRSDEWLARIAQSYTTDKKQIVLGYGRYAKEAGLLNLFIRFETFFNAVQYMGIAKGFRPFMAVGRNLSYTKSVYEKSSKFTTTHHLLSGDDDLFVSEMGKRANTEICYVPEGQTVSKAKRTWREWVAQKSRHLTTSKHYKAGIKFLLGLELVTRQLFLWGGLYLILCGGEPVWIAAAGVLALRWVIQLTALGIAAYRMGEGTLWLWAIPADILVPWVQAAAAAQGYLTKSRNRWK